ncbi:MAG: hypothetical protein FWE66_05630, partial [Oscillospiraceae bacterium]|nr:hypothetical protein [Oscillospiraceae bacterium]
NENLRRVIAELCASEMLPQAILLCGETGTGRNLFARLIAASYLNDSAGLVQRHVHPDCIVVRGSGASGEIPIDAIREASYEVNKSSVMTDGKRTVIIENAYNLNRNSSAALLKTLEQPPPGVIFILTSSGERDLSDTVRSRCAAFYLVSPASDECASFLKSRRDPEDHSLIDEYSGLFRGRIGLVLLALEDSGFAAALSRARIFAKGYIENDILAMLSALDKAEDRRALAEILRIAVFCLAEYGDMSRIVFAVNMIEEMRGYLSFNLAHKLFSTVLVSRLAKSAA